MTRNVSVDTGPSRYTQDISIAATSLVIGGQLRSNCEAEWKPQSGDSEQISGLTPLGRIHHPVKRLSPMFWRL